MSDISTHRIRMILHEDRGFGRISLDLVAYLDLCRFLMDDLDRMENRFASWQTERSQRLAARDRVRRLRAGESVR